jgi:hypothetical protein
LSTTLLTGMTDISLHMQSSDFKGQLYIKENIFYYYGSNSMPDQTVFSKTLFSGNWLVTLLASLMPAPHVVSARGINLLHIYALAQIDQVGSLGNDRRGLVNVPNRVTGDRCYDF